MGVLARMCLLLIGLLAMALIDYFEFSSLRAAVIAAAGLVLGFWLRRPIAERVEHYRRVVPAGLFLYSAVVFLGDSLGLAHSTKLAIITATTVVIFDLQFWSLSDPSVVNTERRMS
ncbi:MAG TPA: hypothetical protein VFX96_18745 [Pyrinomonadaceae bacterium]|nr:hypothetical protein [Pyrinomonadaceae bacterium]